MNRVAVSKYLSYLLRHDPGRLDMDQRGFAPVEQVIEYLRKRFPAIDQRKLRQLLDDSNKQRFEFSGGTIRACYGHFIPVDIAWPVADDVVVLYHGTTENAARSILKQGLQPRSRQMVYLSATSEQARQVGHRHGPPVVLRIDTAAAHHQGVTFYRATGQVYLAGHVPAASISRGD